jgi:hypothetical protein
MEDYILSRKIYNNVKNCFVSRGATGTINVTLPPHEASKGFSRYILTTQQGMTTVNMTIPIVYGSSSKIFPLSLTIIDIFASTIGTPVFNVIISVGSKTQQVLTVTGGKTSQTLCFERTIEDFYIR